MKKNKNLIIAIAATSAVTGVAAFLFGTKKGKRITSSWKEQGKKITEDVKDLIEDAKEKFDSLRKEFLKEDKKKEKTVEEANKVS